jgi:hypothetical protein
MSKKSEGRVCALSSLTSSSLRQLLSKREKGIDGNIQYESNVT